MTRPTKLYAEVKSMLGASIAPWEQLVGQIRYHYEIDEIWAEGKPTHKHRNNLYFKRGGKSLLILGLREDYFLACVVLGAKEREKFEEQRSTFSQEVCNIYDQAETLHDGKWLGFEVRDSLLVDDIFRLIQIKRKPNRKVFPDNIDLCGRLDIGLPHEEITKLIG